MKRTLAIAFVLLLSAGGVLEAQQRRASGSRSSSGSSGQAVRRPSDSNQGSSTRSTPSSTPAPAPSTATSSGDSRTDRAQGRRPTSSPSAGDATTGNTNTANRSGRSDDTATTTATARARDGQTVRGQAVPRRPGSTPGGGGTTVIVGNGFGYYPWAYGGFGLGSYWGGFYDPWYWGGGGGYPYGGYGGGYGYYNDNGAVRLKIQQRDASVYVDGYYAGLVDDYDGVFQRLRLEPGPHRIEVRQDGFEPLMFEIRIQPDRTITYRGKLVEASEASESSEAPSS